MSTPSSSSPASSSARVNLARPSGTRPHSSRSTAASAATSPSPPRPRASTSASSQPRSPSGARRGDAVEAELGDLLAPAAHHARDAHLREREHRLERLAAGQLLHARAQLAGRPLRHGHVGGHERLDLLAPQHALRRRDQLLEREPHAVVGLAAAEVVPRRQQTPVRRVEEGVDVATGLTRLDVAPGQRRGLDETRERLLVRHQELGFDLHRHLLPRRGGVSSHTSCPPPCCGRGHVDACEPALLHHDVAAADELGDGGAEVGLVPDHHDRLRRGRAPPAAAPGGAGRTPAPAGRPRRGARPGRARRRRSRPSGGRARAGSSRSRRARGPWRGAASPRAASPPRPRP